MNAACLFERQQQREIGGEHVDAAADEIRHRRQDSAIGHMEHVQRQPGLQQFDRQLRRAAGAARSERDLARVGTRIGGELRQILDRNAARDRDTVRDANHPAQRKQICGSVRKVGTQQRREHHVVDAADQQRMAVRSGLRHALCSDRTARPCAILDDHGLPERARERRRDRARHQIRLSARFGGDHDVNRAIRIGLCGQRLRGQRVSGERDPPGAADAAPPRDTRTGHRLDRLSRGCLTKNHRH